MATSTYWGGNDSISETVDISILEKVYREYE